VVIAKDWVIHCEHYIKVQDEDLLKTRLNDDILDPIIMTINPDESSSSEDDDNGEGLILNNLNAYLCTKLIII